MIKRTCLIIDNEDQHDEITKLKRDSHYLGIDLDCYQFEVGNTAYTEVLTSGKIDLVKVELEVKRRFKNVVFNIVACDYELDDAEINGVELLRNFNNKNIFKYSPKLIYSGVLDDILRDIVEPNLGILKIEGKPDKAIIKQVGLTKIKSLIRYRIYDYLDRHDRDPIIIKFLSEEIQSTELIITQTLNMFPDFQFENNFINKKFNGKTFKEVAEFLEKDDKFSGEFKREIIQQVISYLTEKI